MRHEVSHLIHYESLLQNATDIITKCDCYFITKCAEVYYKILQVFYYKMRQLLQNATILLQNLTVFTKCDVCYKLRHTYYNIIYCNLK